MKQLIFTDEQVNSFLQEILRQMWQDNFKPDLIVGLSRGGVVPAIKLSHYLDCTMHSLSIRMSDGIDNASNAVLAKYALQGKRILIIDDISDTGNTLNWLRDDWAKAIDDSPEQSDQLIFHKTIKFATLVENSSSVFDVNYSGMKINKHETPDLWCVFPWEKWWN